MDSMESIKATFFQECEELLADLESGLLALQAGEGDAETVNAVFRAVHSVKGGAGAFGLESLVRFAHVFETTLDGVRNGGLDADPPLVAVMLRAADRLADHVAAAKAGNDPGEEGDADLIKALEAYCGVEEPSDAGEPDFGFSPMLVSLDASDDDGAAPSASPPMTSLSALTPTVIGWTIEFRPHPGLYRNANDAMNLIRELARLGPVDVTLNSDAVPDLDGLNTGDAWLSWTVNLDAGVHEDQVREVFEFVDGDCDLQVHAVHAPADAEGPEPADLDSAPLAPEGSPGEEGLSLAALLALARGGEASPEDGAAAAQTVAAPSFPEPQSSTAPKAAARANAPTAGENIVQTTIRVDLERVDRLIDLVGELVINQAMLAQQVHEAGIVRSGNIALGLDDLEQLTREIQDSVMAIRAQPVKSVFQRMPRLIREVAGMTGKSVRLVTDGEGTEVDKTVIERLSDPLTHMIRNAIDHGLEAPDDRVAAGKPREGVIRLSAQHRSGRIVIEVADDGRGIDRARVKAIAAERGLIEPDAVLSDEEVDNLIFAPGFSTASEVSDISGRGVGMDVVKRSIQALGGRITITSIPGKGSTFTLSLPLTLAVLDGMVVSVGSQTLVVPITVIVETLQPKAADIRGLGPDGAVLSVRGSHVPLIDVATALDFDSDPASGAGVTLLVESDLGGLAALRVDGIQGQRQVVIKSLEQNYDQVPGIAAATILGDGRVALILDVDGVIARRRQAAPRPAPLAQAS
ncbi:MAG: chemotaxis protein CheA [Alphaproteobacteria bacterium]|nr:chemotaxis protein CheA [Alphaproteobacteria bacterium]MBU2040652.1 chemotaxis protein CheA [Alphaproteobacteria bacterium]MBU2125665.1 chemotaxis protein CheA [Alphaproteobacteria bacterium]MBU2209072.1 chemotaxis protein CheA [Alphaproteobacteria bacterium]MBU2397382.1 chemotaxis protein CheA [Alphaproteobacteria bacterium]